jgi:hypothetical protein
MEAAKSASAKEVITAGWAFPQKTLTFAIMLK